MAKAKIIAALLLVFVSSPIWFYLLYRILDAINATELMWFLYWVYVPVAIFTAVITRLATEDV